MQAFTCDSMHWCEAVVLDLHGSCWVQRLSVNEASITTAEVSFDSIQSQTVLTCGR
jgi:hypothetical protein